MRQKGHPGEPWGNNDKFQGLAMTHTSDAGKMWTLLQTLKHNVWQQHHEHFASKRPRLARKSEGIDRSTWVPMSDIDVGSAILRYLRSSNSVTIISFCLRTKFDKFWYIKLDVHDFALICALCDLQTTGLLNRP